MELDSFVISAAVLLAVAAVSVTLFKQLGLGAVLGLLVAGIAVGPYSPGPAITSNVEDVRHFTELGVVLLLFLIGLEMRPTKLWSMRREVFGLGSLQILLSGGAIGAYSFLYQESWGTAMLIGFSLALSSTAFVLQLLQEKGELSARLGSTSFSVLLMQDLAIVPLLALVPLLSDVGTLSAEVPLWVQLLIVVGVLLLVGGTGRYLIPHALERLSRKNNREAFFLVVMLAVFAASAAMHFAGLSMALGAFLMGMLLSGSRYSFQIQAQVEPYKGLLMSLFFVAVGMSIDIGALAERPFLFTQHVVVVLALKIGVLYVLARAFGHGRGIATRLSFLLAQSGEFGFVLFGSAKALGVIDDATFVLAVGVISTSMLLTPLLVRVGDALAMRAPSVQEQSLLRQFDGDHPQPRVVMGGYGRVGHTVAALLQASDIPHITFDTNVAHVAEGQADGHAVYYGDIGDPDLLAAINLDQAETVVLTIDDPPTVMRAVSLIRGSHPGITIIARARDLTACAALIEAGADVAHPEALEASLRLGADVMTSLGIDSRNINEVLGGAREDDYALVREDTAQ
ncbi:MAG: cation:proton antiporter [Sedimenticola sp.]|nr:cation:proton antiporter [Sedimenticola sp.]